MRILRNLPIRHKLTLITMVISGVALLLACAAFAFFEQRTFKRSMARDFAVLADMFDDNVASGLAFNDPASIAQTLSSFSAHQYIAAACVYNQEGEIVADYIRAGGDDPVVFPPAGRTGQQFGPNRLHTFKEISLAGDVIGVVYIATDLGELREREWRYVMIAGGLLAGCSLVALLLTARLQKIISGPIVDLAQTVATVAAEKNYSVRAHKKSDDELGRLIEGFNEMLAQIQSRDLELQKAHDELEARVNDRTRELQQEIGERRFSEEALRQSHLRFEMVTRATTDIIYDWDLETDSVWFNENYQLLFGFQPHEVPQTSTGWVACIHPDDLASVKESLETALKGDGQAWAAEYRYRRSSGLWANIYDRAWVLRDDKGRPARLIGAMQDISERKRAQVEAAREHARFKFIFEAVPVGISLMWDGDVRPRLVNPAHARITGISMENSTLPDVFAKATHPDDYRRQQELMQPFIRREADHYSVEKRYLHADGRAVWVVLTSRRFLDPQTGEQQSITTLVDITERKEAEADLAETHKQLLDTSRLAGMAEVATGVLHNVGNVLNSVNVSATLVMDRVRESKTANLPKLSAMLQDHAADLGDFLTNDPKGRRIPGYLTSLSAEIAQEQQSAIQELSHLRKNIEHIKDIVTMQQSYAKVSGVTEPVAITELVEDALRMNASALARHGLEVVRQYDADPVVTIERHKAMQILVNLIRNAKQACDESGRTDKRVTVRITTPPRRVRVEIADNGIGIPPENLARVFAHGFTTRRDGHGFGLHSGAIAAKEIGGSLVAQSEGPGKGATFIFELPNRPEPKIG